MWLKMFEDAAKKKRQFTQEEILKDSLWATGPFSDFEGQIKFRDGEVKKGPTDIYLILYGIYLTMAMEKHDVATALNFYIEICKQVEDLKNGTDKITIMNNFRGCN